MIEPVQSELTPSRIANVYQNKFWLRPSIHSQPVYNLLSLPLSETMISNLKIRLQSAFKQIGLLANRFEIINEMLMYNDASQDAFEIENITDEALTAFLQIHFNMSDDKLLRVFYISNRKTLILVVHPILIHAEALYYLGQCILENLPLDSNSFKPRIHQSNPEKNLADLNVLFKPLLKKSNSNRFSKKNHIELRNNNLELYTILATLLVFLHKYCNNKKVSLLVKVLTGKEFTCHLLNINFSDVRTFEDVVAVIKDSVLSEATTIPPLEFGNYSPELANRLGLLPVLTILPSQWQHLELEQSHGSHPLLFEYCSSSNIFNIQFNTDFFTTYTNQFLESIEYCFRNLTLNSSAVLVDTEILSPKMKEDIFKISRNYSKTSQHVIYDAIFSNPAFQPELTAVALNQEKLSYGELQKKVTAFCQLLLGQCLKDKSVIAVYMDRSVEMIVTLISIWRLGYVYLPITKNYPSHLLQHVLENANAEVAVTNLELSIQNSVKVIDWKTLNILESPIFPNPQLSPESLAYIIYTSGTTGLPKGVKVNHKSICDQVEWMKSYFGITTYDRILHKTSIGFDVSLWELLLPLISGSKLILLEQGKESDPEAIVDAIIKLGITVIHFVPPLLEIVLEHVKIKRIPKDALCCLRHVICSGSALSEKLRSDFQQLMPESAKLSNLYGPTEGVIDHSFHTFESFEEGEVPIGRPIPGKSVYILDDNQKIVPGGVVGEIVLGGNLANGYIGNIPGEKKFIPSPFPNETMLYRTGDLGIIIEEKIYYRGRNDRQVKLNGIRIELDGIENIIQKSGINCAVVAKKNTNGEAISLVAYVQGEVNLGNLKRYLANTLAHIAGNIIFVKKEKLPLSTNQKISYKDLEQDVETLPLNTAQFTMPQCFTQYTLLKIWQEVLAVDSQISMTASFFEVGGNSLLAIKLLGRIKQDFNRTIPVVDFLQAPTIQGLSTLLGGNFADSPTTPVFPLKIKAGLPSSFWVHPVGGLGFPYALLSDHLKQYSTYAISDPYFSSSDFSFSTITEMAEYYVAAIRKIQSVGPYVIGGVSFGGMVALEMARILQKANCIVKAVIMIDSYNMAKADITILNKYEQLQIPRIIEFLKNDGVDPDSLEGKAMIKEVRTNVFLQKQHQPQPYYGKVVLIKAQIADPGGNFGFAKDPVNGWIKTLCPYLAIRSVNAMHKNIISMENIVAVSDLINDELAKLDCTSLDEYCNEATYHLDRAQSVNDIFLIDLLNPSKNHEQRTNTTNRSKEMKVIVIVQQYGANKIDWAKVKREHTCLLYAVINNGTRQVLEETGNDKCFEKIYSEEQFSYEKISLHIQDILSRHDRNDLRIVSTDEQALIMCSKIRDNLKIPGPSFEECLPFRDKISMKQAIMGKVAEHLPKHVKFDREMFQQDQRKYLTEIIDHVGLPAFIKPIDGDGSRDARKVNSYEELLESCKKIVQGDVKFEIDQFIAGELYHCDSIVKNGQIILSLVSKYLYPVADFHHGKACTSVLLDKKDPSYQRFTEFNKKILSAFPKVPDGVTHLEFFVTPEDKLIFIEVAARSPGAIVPESIELTVGINLREVHCLLQGGLDIHPVVKETGKYAACVYFPKQVGKVVELVPPKHFSSEYKIVSKMNCDIEVKTPPNSLLDFAYTMIFSNQSRELLMKDFESLREFNPVRVFKKQPSNSNLSSLSSALNPNPVKVEQKEDKKELITPTP